MITQQHYDRLKVLINLRSATNGEGQEIVKYYKMFINPGANICATCPDSLAPAFKRLKDWFNSNEQNILNTLEAKTNKKKVDAPVVIDKKESEENGSQTNTDNQETIKRLQSSSKENKKSRKSKKTLE